MNNLDIGIKFDILNSDIIINKLYYLDERKNTKNHFHSYIEIHYITNGECNFGISFNEFVSVKQNEIIILGKNVYHEEQIIDTCSGFCFGVEIHTKDEKSIFNCLNSINFIIKQNQINLCDILNNIIIEYKNKKEGYTEYCKNLFSLLLINIARICFDGDKKTTKQNSSKQLRNEDILYEVDAFFNRVFDYRTEDLTSEALAKILFVSKRHLNRLLHEYYHMNFIQLLNRTKMKFTQYLLINTNKSIEEIGEMCGFTCTYLIRCFKREYGQTPYQYKQNHTKQT